MRLILKIKLVSLSMFLVFLCSTSVYSQSLPKIVGMDNTTSNTAALIEKDENFSTILSYTMTDIFEDPDGDVLYYTAISDSGIVNAVMEDGKVILTSKLNQFGIDTVTVIADDQKDGKAYFYIPFLISEVEGNQPPEVQAIVPAQERSENFQNIFVLDLTQVFRDPDGGTLTFVTESQNGVVSPEIDGNNLRISSITNQSGNDVVTITATDPDGASVSTTISIIVTEIVGNQAPRFLGTIPTFVKEKNFENISSYNLAEMVEDNDGDELTFSVSTLYGFVNARTHDDTLLYLSNIVDAEGIDSVKIVVSDGNGGSDTLVFAAEIGDNLTKNLLNPLVMQQSFNSFVYNRLGSNSLLAIPYGAKNVRIYSLNGSLLLSKDFNGIEVKSLNLKEFGLSSYQNLLVVLKK